MNRRQEKMAMLGGYVERTLKLQFEHIALARNKTSTDQLAEIVARAIEEHKELLAKPRGFYLRKQLETAIKTEDTSGFPWLDSVVTKSRRNKAKKVTGKGNIPLKSIAALALCLLALGCANTDRIMLDTSKRAPTANVEYLKGDLATLRTTRLTKTFTSIAELTFLGPPQDEGKAIRHFMREGRRLGADVVVYSGWDSAHTTASFGNIGMSYIFRATAIAYDKAKP